MDKIQELKNNIKMLKDQIHNINSKIYPIIYQDSKNACIHALCDQIKLNNDIIKKESKMNFSDRLYWFWYNLKRYPFCLIFLPFVVLQSAWWLTKILFLKTDGSQTLVYPWEDRE